MVLSNMNRGCAIIVVLMLGGQAAAQQAPTVLAPGGSAKSAPAQDAFGRPCLDIGATVRAQITNTAIVDHVVSVQNRCPKTISVKVCYFGSERCNRLDVQPYRRSDTILGTMAGVRFFRYDVTELNVGQPAGATKSFTYMSRGL